MLTLLLMSVSAVAMAQMEMPVKFTASQKQNSPEEVVVSFKASIDKGWHVYSTGLPADGPTSAELVTEVAEGAQPVGKLTHIGKEISEDDPIFGMKLRFFENNVTFQQKYKITGKTYRIKGYLNYGACNDEMCMPPSQVELKKSGTIEIKNEKLEMSHGNEETGNDATDVTKADSVCGDSISHSSSLISHPADSLLWAPVVSELRAEGDSDNLAGQSLWYILLMGFVGGLLAVLMPCIWPIIPMTVSFFLKRSKSDKGKGVRDALTYGLSIIVIYLALGLLVTALFGPDTLNAMSTNAVFNVLLFLLLVVFALSFFGWFEIKLPDSWANKVDAKADELSTHHSPLTSHLSIFLMAFTLVLVSFSCTAPIIGLLLVETTTSGNWLAPAMGMFGFAVALALPFTLFALFPSWLKQAPKSGSWMNTLKVVLGFVELAFALKFLSVADLAYGWHILDREVFLSLWIVIFGLLGAYLCGWLKFQTDEIGGEISKPMPVVCIMGGLLSLAFAIYMVPGLWGAPCKAVSAFAPPISTQDFNLNTKVVEAHYTDYEQGMAAARQQGKPVFIDFTGFGCVNCRKMEAAVWTDPRVADRLTKDYVLISLFVDDKTLLAEPYEVTDERGNKKVLRTVGAKWSYLQSHKFGANAQPFYVLLNNDGHPLCGSRAYNEDVPAFLDFLNTGLQRYRK